MNIHTRLVGRADNVFISLKKSKENFTSTLHANFYNTVVFHSHIEKN